MPELNYLAVLVATAVAFVIGGLWYSSLLFGTAYQKLLGSSAEEAVGSPPVGEIVAEFARCLILVVTLGGFVAVLNVTTVGGAVGLALAVWFGFQATSIVGGVVHERYPWRLFVIHAGDALAKTVIVTVILTVWR